MADFHVSSYSKIYLKKKILRSRKKFKKKIIFTNVFQKLWPNFQKSWIYYLKFPQILEGKFDIFKKIYNVKLRHTVFAK